MNTEEERTAEEYKATLSELNSNSKVEINALTMLAEDNKDYAVNIAACIENQLKSVPNKRKLPILYLIDSIFSDERVRKSLHKLRMTWNATKIFPQKKLNAIDERVHEMDPNWPILHKIVSGPPQQSQLPIQQRQPQQPQQPQQPTPQLPQQQQQLQLPVRNDNQASTTSSVPNNPTKRSSHSNGRRKRSKSGANRNNNQPKDKKSQPAAVLVSPAQTLINPTLIQASLVDIPQVLPTAFMDPSITMIKHNDQLHQVPNSTFIDPNMIINPTEPQSTATQILCTPYNHQQQQTTHCQPKQDFQPTHLSVLESLYGGKQCSNCSLRFDDNNRYSIHLDWHFRQNLKSDNMFARRKWYYPLNLWVQFREINDEDLQDSNNVDSNNVKDSLLLITDDEMPTAPASKDDENNICSVCHENFEKFWAEEEEEWRLRNAKLFEDQRVYHPLCLIDMLQAADATTAVV